MSNQLSPDQRAEVLAELDESAALKPVRFLRNGRAYNITNGESTPKDTNVVHQMVYWKFTRETATKIAQWLDMRPVFG